MLSHHPLVELVLHVHEPLRLGLLDPRDGNSGPTTHDEGDVLHADFGPVALPLFLPLVLLVADLLLELSLLIPQLGGALEVLIANGPFLLLGYSGQLGLEPLHLRRRHLAGDASPSAGLVDDVDGLVGKEPVRDVAVRESGRMGQRIVGNGDAVMVLVVTAEAL